MCPDIVIRHDVHQAHFEHALGMIEAQPKGGARAAIMTRDEELAVPELIHHLDQVLRHRTEAEIVIVHEEFAPLLKEVLSDLPRIVGPYVGSQDT